MILLALAHHHIGVSQLMANTNVVQKSCLKFKKNAIGHTFVGQPTCQPDITIHV